MLGRIDAVLAQILEKYNFEINTQNPDTAATLRALAEEIVYTDDRDLCLWLAEHAERLARQIPANGAAQAENDIQRQIGRRELPIIMKRFPGNYIEHIFDDVDIYEGHMKQVANKRRENRRTFIVAAILVVILAAILVIYNLPTFAEERAFERVKTAYENDQYYETISLSKEYIDAYPDGKHFDEIQYLRVLAVQRHESAIATIQLIDTILSEQPHGVYTPRFTELYNKIWDEQIEKFNKQTAHAKSPQARQFFLEMLKYMRDNHINRVTIEPDPTLNFKEFTQYPLSTQNLIEAIFIETAPDDLTPLTRAGLGSFQSNIVPITKQINDSTVDAIATYITRDLASTFDKLTTYNFVTFNLLTPYTSNEPNADKFPVVKATYTIRNKEIQKGIPDIWMNSTKLGTTTTSNKFFMHLATEYHITFTIPGSDRTLTFKGAGAIEEAEEVKDIDDKDFYLIMLGKGFRSFQKQLDSDLGI